MRKKVIILALGFAVSAAFSNLFAQNGLPDFGIQGNLALGVVKMIGAEKIVIETKDGMIDSVLVKSTVFKRLSPDNLSLKAATESNFSELGVGDRVLVTGKVSEDRKTVVTTAVYLVKGSDLAAKQAKIREDWQRRGIAGKITLVDKDALEITVEMRGITGAVSTIKVQPKETVKFLRYSPESPRYSDAIESSIEEIEPENMIHALGDRSEDGTSFLADEIITGAFQTHAGKVKSVDTEKNEVTISDLKTNEDVTIVIRQTSMLKRFPEETAQRLARVQMMMGSGGVRPPGSQAGGQRPERPSGQGGEGRPGMGGGMRGDINDMLTRFPTITVSDLKEGDMIAVSSPKGKDPGRITAIKLLAGVEPFLMMAQMNSEGRGRGVQGLSSGISIPGLDSVEF